MKAESGRDDDLAAGRAALARGDWPTAQARFSAALARGETAEALEGLGWAQWWLDQPLESLATRERAYLLYRQQKDPRRAARVAVHLAIDGAEFHGEAVTSGWLERARSLLAPLPPSVEHGWLALWCGHVALYFRDDRAEARRQAAAATALARGYALADLELLARSLEGLVLVRDGQVAEGMRRLDEATAAAVAGEIENLDAVGITCCFLVYACEHVRDYERAGQWHRRVEELCRQWRLADVFASCRTKHAQLLFWQGRWPEAEATLQDVVRAVADKWPPTAREACAYLGELRRRQGRLAEAEELFARAEGLSASWLGRAALALDRGDAASAAEMLDRAARRASPDNYGLRAVVGELAVRARLALGDSAAAAAAAAEVEAIAARAGTPPIRAAARQVAGLLAAASERTSEAVAAFEDAIDLFHAAAAPFETARARLDLAAALACLDRRERAADELAAAHAAFAALGAAAEVARAEAAQAALRDSTTATRPAGAARDPATPTAREREVLRLVAAGLSDRAIARSLHLSEHTVHRHVANLFDKLDCSSRAAAVAKASRLGLL